MRNVPFALIEFSPLPAALCSPRLGAGGTRGCSVPWASWGGSTQGCGGAACAPGAASADSTQLGAQHPPRGSAPTGLAATHFSQGFFFSRLGCKSPSLLVEHMPVGAVLAVLTQRPVSVCLSCSWSSALQLVAEAPTWGAQSAPLPCSPLVPVPLPRLRVGALPPEDEPRSPQSPK